MEARPPRLSIACIGSSFEAGVQEALIAAAQRCVEAGVKVEMCVHGNRCVEPYHGLAMMRNQGIIDALGMGATHLLIVDNDILFEDLNALCHLLDTGKDAVVPYFNQGRLDTLYRLSEPLLEAKAQGLKPLQWVFMGCVLFDLAVFRQKGVDIRLFHDHMAVGEDAYYWSYLRLFGVECWQDTDVEVTLLKPPTPMWDARARGSVEVIREGVDVHTVFRRPEV